MGDCNFSGNAEMYGLGIRLGYYLLWFGTIFACWLAPSEVPLLRLFTSFFISASFLATIILLDGDVKSLQPAEVYIVLLLMFGTSLVLIPIYVWRLCARCDPYWDPTRYPIVRTTALFANLNLLLLVALLCFQFWFWFARVPDLRAVGCQQYGFFFARIRLDNEGFVAANVLLFVVLALVVAYIVMLKVRNWMGYPDPPERRRNVRRQDKLLHINFLQNLDSILKLTVAAIVTSAIEMTIQWNHIRNVYSLASTGQTIPFVIGLGLILRILYVSLQVVDDDDSETDYTYYSGSTSTTGRRRRSEGRGHHGGQGAPRAPPVAHSREGSQA